MVHTFSLGRVLPDRREVILHARQGICANGLDAGLLQGVIDLRAVHGGRLGATVNPRVMVGDPQGHLIGEAPYPGRFGPRKLARRMGQYGLVTLEAGTVAREDHFQIRLLGQGARRIRQGALKGFPRGLFLGHETALDVSRPSWNWRLGIGVLESPPPLKPPREAPAGSRPWRPDAPRRGWLRYWRHRPTPHP